ncbi:MAG: hypothetical protein WC536_04415 [Patescibacteria group bacterium]|jgi:acyl-coenzyme A thioesterase PaaI-like protein
MKKVSVMVMSLCFVLMATATLADFSYSVSINKHDVIVTKLDNGKSFLKINGKLVKQAKFQNEKAHRFQEGSLIIQLYENGRVLQVEPKKSFFLTIEPKDELMTGTIIKLGKKQIVCAEGSISDDEKGHLYFFQHVVIKKLGGNEDGQKLVISQQSHAKELPKLFIKAVGTFKERRVG